MEKIDFAVIGMFFLIVASLFFALHLISKFMPVLATCEDDFEIINQCGCVPCNWRDAMKYNMNMSCIAESLNYER